MHLQKLKLKFSLKYLGDKPQPGGPTDENVPINRLCIFLWLIIIAFTHFFQ